MGKGIDDHLAGGGSVEDYKEVDINKEMKTAVAKEKDKLAGRVATVILKAESFLSMGETLYRLELNALGGGFYRMLDDREVAIAVQRVSDKNYTRKLRDDVKDLLHNASFVKRDKVNVMTGELNLINGVLDVKSKSLRPFDKGRDFYTYQIPIKFNPKAECVEWERVMSEIFRDGCENVQLVQQIFGYCLQTAVNNEKFFVFCGNGANGKGVVTHVLSNLVGMENITALGLEKLGDSKWSEALVDKMVNLATESDSRASKWSETMKIAVSGEPIMVNPKYKPVFSFKPIAKHIITMNEEPYIEDKSDGVVRRMIIVPFDRKFEEHEQDLGLKGRLVRDELSGVLNWAIAGLESYALDGFSVPEANLQMARDVKRNSSSIMIFVDEFCEVADVFDVVIADREGGDELYIPTKEFYNRYKEWCLESGHKPYSLTKATQLLKKDFNIVSRPKKFDGVLFRAYFGVTWGYT